MLSLHSMPQSKWILGPLSRRKVNIFQLKAFFCTISRQIISEQSTFIRFKMHTFARVLISPSHCMQCIDIKVNKLLIGLSLLLLVVYNYSFLSTLFHIFFVVKIVMCVFEKTKKNKKEAGLAHLKMESVCLWRHQ